MCLAIPGQVVEIVDEERRLAKVDVVGVRRTVNIGLLDSEVGSPAFEVGSPADDTRSAPAGDSLGSFPDAAEPTVTGVRPGDWVLIHVGFAMSRIDEAEAQATLRLLEEMGAEYEDEIEDLRGSEIQ